MTDAEMSKLWNSNHKPPVRVTANDYAYDGWLVTVFQKRSGQWRCAVEDSNGRLFIHNSAQLATRT